MKHDEAIRDREMLPTRSNADRRPCQCGVCRVCISNARWERLYNEKFADPAYYSGLRFSNRSPITGF